VPWKDLSPVVLGYTSFNDALGPDMTTARALDADRVWCGNHLNRLAGALKTPWALAPHRRRVGTRKFVGGFA
jgi:hypothetical protein